MESIVVKIVKFIKKFMKVLRTSAKIVVSVLDTSAEISTKVAKIVVSIVVILYISIYALYRTNDYIRIIENKDKKNKYNDLLLFPIGSITKIEISNEDADRNGLEVDPVLEGNDPPELEEADQLDEDKFKE